MEKTAVEYSKTDDMPAPTALLRQPEELAEKAANIPLPVDSMCAS